MVILTLGEGQCRALDDRVARGSWHPEALFSYELCVPAQGSIDLGGWPPMVWSAGSSGTSAHCGVWPEQPRYWKPKRLLGSCGGRGAGWGVVAGLPGPTAN